MLSLVFVTAGTMFLVIIIYSYYFNYLLTILCKYASYIWIIYDIIVVLHKCLS